MYPNFMDSVTVHSDLWAPIQNERFKKIYYLHSTRLELETVINNPGLGPTRSEQTGRIYSQTLFKELKPFPMNNWLKDDACAWVILAQTIWIKHAKCSSRFPHRHPPPASLVPKLWTFVSKAMSLLFNTLSRFVIAFLPRSEHLLISWLQSQSTVILEPQYKIKSFFFKSTICPAQGWELGAVIKNLGLVPTLSEPTRRIYSPPASLFPCGLEAAQEAGQVHTLDRDDRSGPWMVIWGVPGSARNSALMRLSKRGFLSLYSGHPRKVSVSAFTGSRALAESKNFPIPQLQKQRRNTDSARKV